MIDKENQLLSALEKGISEAWNYHPLSYRANELQEVFRNCKDAISELAEMGSETGIDRIAYIYRECIRDGFGSSTGIRNRALNVLINCKHPLARFHLALITENLKEICEVLVEQPSLRIRLVELAEKVKDIDPFESPHNLIRQISFAEKAFRTYDNKELLNKVLIDQGKQVENTERMQKGHSEYTPCQLGQIYKCEVCGTEIICIKAGKGQTTCCGKQVIPEHK